MWNRTLSSVFAWNKAIFYFSFIWCCASHFSQYTTWRLWTASRHCCIRCRMSVCVDETSTVSVAVSDDADCVLCRRRASTLSNSSVCMAVDSSRALCLNVCTLVNKNHIHIQATFYASLNSPRYNQMWDLLIGCLKVICKGISQNLWKVVSSC